MSVVQREFRFRSSVTAWDLWRMSMHRIYHSLVGVSNLVLAVALIALTVRFWDPHQQVLMSLLVLACILFPVLQPVSVYLRAARQVSALPEDLELLIDETGLHTACNGQKNHVSWKQIRGLMQEHGMLILAAESGIGYLLTDRMLGEQKAELITYVEGHLER